MIITKLEMIEAKPGKRLPKLDQPTVRVSNYCNSSHNGSNEVKKATFVFRKEAVELLEMEVSNSISVWRCWEGNRMFYAVALVPSDLSEKTFTLVEAPPDKLKFSCCELYKKLEDGVYVLNTPQEQKIPSGDILVMSELSLYSLKKIKSHTIADPLNFNSIGKY